MEGHLTAEISASAVRHNLLLLRRFLRRDQRLCAVVKADCYGHGLKALLPIIAELADSLAVAMPEEAVDVRAQGYAGPLLAFFSVGTHGRGAESQAVLRELIARRVALTVVDETDLAAIDQAARNLGTQAEVHVKIDTGMGRRGVLGEAAQTLIAQAQSKAAVKLAGVYTHLATADESDKSEAMKQLERFLATLKAPGPPAGVTIHAANSAAAIDLPSARLDMIRPGIAVYGYQPSDQMHTSLPLRPALRLMATLAQVKTLPAGSRCGYGLTHIFDVATRVGLVPVGYADGYLRCLSNRAVMRVNGCDAPVRGRISMDQTIIDLSGVGDVRAGDSVEIISSDPAAPNSVESLSRLAGTIPYEIPCLLGRRVRRTLVD